MIETALVSFVLMATTPVAPNMSALDCDGTSLYFEDATQVQNCYGSEPISRVSTTNIPTHVTFTGNCVNNECEYDLMGMHSVSSASFNIDPGKQLWTHLIKVTFSSIIHVTCPPRGDCLEISVSVCDEEWLSPTISPCT